MEKLLAVQVMNPNKILWKGEAKSISSKNNYGPFDLLPEHANFVTLVKKEPIIIRGTEEEKTFSFDSAVIYIHKNEVLIFAQIESKI
jgi:F0F1-type ATP synthase epsilon subunit